MYRALSALAAAVLAAGLFTLTAPVQAAPSKVAGSFSSR